MTKNQEPEKPKSDDEALFDIIWEEFNPLLVDTLGLEYAILGTEGLIKRILDEGFTRKR